MCFPLPPCGCDLSPNYPRSASLIGCFYTWIWWTTPETDTYTREGHTQKHTHTYNQTNTHICLFLLKHFVFSHLNWMQGHRGGQLSFLSLNRLFNANVRNQNRPKDTKRKEGAGWRSSTLLSAVMRWRLVFERLCSVIRLLSGKHKGIVLGLSVTTFSENKICTTGKTIIIIIVVDLVLFIRKFIYFCPLSTSACCSIYIKTCLCCIVLIMSAVFVFL